MHVQFMTTFVLPNLISNLFPRPQVVSTLLPLEFVDIVSIPAGKSGLVLATQLTLTRHEPMIVVN